MTFLLTLYFHFYRSIISELSDLPDACAPKFQHFYDWSEGMQEVRDAVYSSAIFPSLQFAPCNKNNRLVRAFGSGNVEEQ